MLFFCVCFKVHTLMPYFESSTTTEMLISYNCCKKVTGRVQNCFFRQKSSVLGGGGGGTTPTEPPLATPLDSINVVAQIHILFFRV